MKTFLLQIVTPKGVYKEVEIEMLNVRTTTGQIGIYANHIPLASALEISMMNYIINGEREYFVITGGFVYVNDTKTTIITNAIEAKEEIDLSRAMQAKVRAEERLKQPTNIDVQRAELALKKALLRIRVKEET
jgi:F-type H+-transporting ATPase subunit epsilon